MNDFTPLIEETWNKEISNFRFNLKGKIINLFDADLVKDKSPFNSLGFLRTDYAKKTQVYNESKKEIINFLQSDEMTIEDVYKFFLQIQFNMQQSKETIQSKEIKSKVEFVLQKIEEAKPKLIKAKNDFIEEIENKQIENKVTV